MARVVQTPHTAIQPMPPLSAEQLEALRDDIAEHGVRVPVSVDQHGRIIDGNNRAAIAAELGIDCPQVEVHVDDDEAAVDLALTLNCARRHLTREQKRDLIATELERRPDDSDRSIARRLGCSPSTVGAVRKPAEQVSNLDTPMTREEAERSTEQVREWLNDARSALYSLVGFAVMAGATTTEVVGALTLAKMAFVKNSPDDKMGQDFFAEQVYDYVIEMATWDETYEQFPRAEDPLALEVGRTEALRMIVDMGMKTGDHPADLEAAE